MLLFYSIIGISLFICFFQGVKIVFPDEHEDAHHRDRLGRFTKQKKKIKNIPVVLPVVQNRSIPIKQGDTLLGYISL